MKFFALITLLLAFTFQPLVPPCATVSLALDSTSLQPGQTQNMHTTVTNCGDKKIKLGTTVTVTDHTGIHVIHNTIQNFNAGQIVVFDDSYQVASDAPAGTIRVMSIVFDNSPQGNGAELSRHEQTFQVVP